MSIGLDSSRGRGLHLSPILMKRVLGFLSGWAGMKSTAGSEAESDCWLKLLERRH